LSQPAVIDGGDNAAARRAHGAVGMNSFGAHLFLGCLGNGGWDITAM
jgi:hypothetical protein